MYRRLTGSSTTREDHDMSGTQAARAAAGAADEVAPVRAFANGLAVIRAFSRDAPRQTLADVARAVNVSRATARRSLHTLESLGYATTDGRLWRLTSRVLELGYAYLSSESIWEVTEGHLEQLACLLQESATAAALDGDEIVYTARVAVRRIMTMTVDVGTRLPAYATAMGRVMLAGLPAGELESYLDRVELRPMTERTLTSKAALARALDAVRRSGACVVDQELETNVRSASAPIHDGTGRVVGAIQVCCHTSNVSLSALRSRVLPEVRRTALEIDASLRLRLTTREHGARGSGILATG
jgi:IclR family pca regulon transcriptional regulator